MKLSVHDIPLDVVIESVFPHAMDVDNLQHIGALLLVCRRVYTVMSSPHRWDWWRPHLMQLHQHVARSIQSETQRRVYRECGSPVPVLLAASLSPLRWLQCICLPLPHTCRWEGPGGRGYWWEEGELIQAHVENGSIVRGRATTHCASLETDGDQYHIRWLSRLQFAGTLRNWERFEKCRFEFADGSWYQGQFAHGVCGGDNSILMWKGEAFPGAKCYPGVVGFGIELSLAYLLLKIPNGPLLQVSQANGIIAPYDFAAEHHSAWLPEAQNAT